MSAYWWECESCGNKPDFTEVTGTSSLPSFVWDKMLPAEWDQSLLTSPCSKCHSGILRITYEFPRGDSVVLRVIHVVGLRDEDEDDYIAMMWETQPKDYPGERWFDFKYQIRRSAYGLNRPAVFSREGLRDLFGLYRQKNRRE